MRGRRLVHYGCVTYADWLRAMLAAGDADELRRVRRAREGTDDE